MLPYSSAATRPVQTAAAPSEPPLKPWYKKPAFIVAGVLGCVILAGVGFGVYYLFFRTPPPNVVMQISQPDRVLMGEPFTITVSYSNTSPQVLEEAILALTVPDGMSVLGADPSVRVSQQDIGDVGAQGVGSRTFRLIATDGAESVKHVTVALRYHLNGNLASRFEAAAATDITVGSPAIALNFNVPQKTFAGQDFDVAVTYQNRSKTSFGNSKLIFDYPQAFQVTVAEGVEPDSGNREWKIGDLAPDAQGTVKVSGRINGDQQSFFALGVHLQVDIEGRTYTLGTQSATVGISSAPLSLTIVPSGNQNYVASLGEQLNYVLQYRNSSPFPLQNVVIQAALEGQMFNLQTVVSPANLDSVKKTLTWNTSNSPILGTVQPGQTGTVGFQINLANSWPIAKADDQNFTLNVKGTIQSLTVPAGITAAQTLGQAEATTKVRGQVTLESVVYYRDPDSSIVNKGPYPPRADQPTQYTVHWKVRNQATGLSDLHISAVLQSGARLVEVIKSTAASVPIYDSQTGKVTWDVSSLPANQGVFGPPVEAVFRIEATPGTNRIGHDMPLLGDTFLTARDAFTGTAVSQRISPKTTLLPDDAGAASGERWILP